MPAENLDPDVMVVQSYITCAGKEQMTVWWLKNWSEPTGSAAILLWFGGSGGCVVYIAASSCAMPTSGKALSAATACPARISASWAVNVPIDEQA